MKPRASTLAFLAALAAASTASAATLNWKTSAAAAWGGASWVCPDADTDTIVITIPAAKAAVGKLFGRLKAVKNP